MSSFEKIKLQSDGSSSMKEAVFSEFTDNLVQFLITQIKNTKQKWWFWVAIFPIPFPCSSQHFKESYQTKRAPLN
jgi:hypothetical protein